MKTNVLKLISALIVSLILLISCHSSKKIALFENHLYKFNYPKNFKIDSLEIEPKTYMYGVYDSENKNEQNIFRFSITPVDFDINEHNNYVTQTELQLSANKGRTIIKANQDTIINNYKGKYYRFEFSKTENRKAYYKLVVFLMKDKKFHYFAIETPKSDKENKKVFDIFQSIEIK